MTIYVARHGETTWNREGRYQGRLESALSGLGMRQAQALSDAMVATIPHVQRIVSSPLIRCTATAQPSGDRLNLPVETDPQLIEIGHGSWEGRLRQEIEASDPERYRAWRERPDTVVFDGDGETLADVAHRWRRFATSCDGSTVTLVVTHDAVARIALLDALGGELADFWKVPVENAGYAIYHVKNGRWSVVTESVIEHLADLRASVEGQAL